MKKKICALLTLAIFLFCNVPAFASTENSETNEIEGCFVTENLLDGFEENIITNEFEMLEELNLKSKKELVSLGYNSEEIDNLKENVYLKELLEETKRRTTLSSEELKKYGYTNEQITELKKLENKETITVAEAKALSPTVSLSGRATSFNYNASKDMTYFKANFSWNWSSRPLVRHTDIIALGWNGDFYLDRSAGSNYNVVVVDYDSDALNPADIVDEIQLVQYEAGSVDAEIDVNIQNSTYWAKSGEGKIALVQAGEQQVAKLAYKYIHSTTAILPTLAAGGVSISYTGAPFTEEVYPTIVKTSYM